MSVKIAIPIPPQDRYPNYFSALSALGAEGIKASAEADPSDFDGLLLPGGGDICPAYYRQETAGAADMDPALDALQFAVVDRFFKAGKMIFGICRGHQLLNVYFGGTLIQDLQNGKMHDWEQGFSMDKVHMTEALPGSWIAGIYGLRFPTNSAHHQAVDQLGKGLTADMYAPDGIIEAAHHESGRVFSVQWHPERMCFDHRREDTVDGSKVIRWFLDRCLSAKCPG
ncbi:MAG: gamma-glutamyl-gamma-aminobutyrate hydrolase family protein [Clostridia bacterium]|nr:gamma-glutamyl-gamma-aminobutyrate hydrolase family protein [Clostridia bacterium]